jgi:hypothetical protein
MQVKSVTFMNLQMYKLFNKRVGNQIYKVCIRG